MQLTTDANPASFVRPALPAGRQDKPPELNLAVVSAQTFHPFSDFLLHDMGALGDGITSGAAGPTMIRTAPLWGIRAKSQFICTMAARGTIPTAINLHDVPGESGGHHVSGSNRSAAAGSHQLFKYHLRYCFRQSAAGRPGPPPLHPPNYR